MPATTLERRRWGSVLINKGVLLGPEVLSYRIVDSGGHRIRLKLSVQVE